MNCAFSGPTATRCRSCLFVTVTWHSGASEGEALAAACGVPADSESGVQSTHAGLCRHLYIHRSYTHRTSPHRHSGKIYFYYTSAFTVIKWLLSNCASSTLYRYSLSYIRRSRSGSLLGMSSSHLRKKISPRTSYLRCYCLESVEWYNVPPISLQLLLHLKKVVCCNLQLQKLLV